MTSQASLRVVSSSASRSPQRGYARSWSGAIAAAELPVLGPWLALRSGSPCPRVVRVLSQVNETCGPGVQATVSGGSCGLTAAHVATSVRA